MAGTSEIAGGLGLALGLLTPLASLALIGTMTTAALVNHAAKGFWSADNGWELNLYLITVGGALAVTGPGAWSLDAVLGYPVPSGPLPGTLAIVVGIGLGWSRWMTRDRTTP
jgi:putative oxidoreductase